MISPSIHRELARQREADFLREAERARRTGGLAREPRSIAWLSRSFAVFQGLSGLVRPAHPAR